MLRVFIPFAFRVKRIIQNLFTGFNWSSPTKLTNPPLSGFSTTGFSWSNDDSMLVASGNVSPYLAVYTRSGDVLTKLSGNVNTMPTNNTSMVALSPNNSFLACPQNFSPFHNVYQISGTTFTRITNIASPPTATTVAVAWSPNGKILAFGQNASPYVCLYSVLGNTFTRLPDLAGPFDGAAIELAFSPDGTKLAVGLSSPSSNALQIYSVSGNTFTKLTLPSVSVIGTLAYRLRFTSDGSILIVGSGASPFLTAWSVGPTTISQIANAFDVLPEATVRGLSISPDGQFVKACISLSSAVENSVMYKRNGNSFVKQVFPDYAVDASQACEFSNIGNYLAIGTNVVSGQPSIALHKATYTGGSAPTLFREPKVGEFYSRQPPYFHTNPTETSGLGWHWNGVDLGYEGDGPVTVGEWTYYKGAFQENTFLGDWHGIYRTKAI